MASKQLKIPVPPEFSGPAQLLLFTRYGDPRVAGFEQKWITEWFVQDEFPWFPKRTICVHKHFKALLQNAFRDLTALGLQTEIKTCDKAYIVRHIRGSKGVMSVHSWGCGLDMNVNENLLGSVGSWSKEFIEVMVNNNIYCGQNWIGRKDPMHFAMVNG